MAARMPVAAGDRFGRLVYIEERAPRSNRRRALFRCDCGREVEIAFHDAHSGHTVSCGCFHTERQRSARSHGATVGDRAGTPEYRCWKAMKGRCLNPNNSSYARYGGRGITVCDRWHRSFEDFLADMGRKPTREHTIDRIDSKGNYEPGNCRWATKVEQRRNTCTVRPVTIDGETQLITDWAKVSGVPEESISSRLRKGWSPKDAVFRPVERRA